MEAHVADAVTMKLVAFVLKMTSIRTPQRVMIT